MAQPMSARVASTPPFTTPSGPLTVRADGFQPYSQSVNLPEGATREIVAQLQKQ